MSRDALKILVVDDECHICEMMDEFLSLIGFQVMTAADGVHAVKMFDTERPDVVFLDIKMPGISGIEVLRQLRSRERTFGVVMLSAFGDDRTIGEAMDGGADYYLQKPVDFVRLREILASLEQSLGRHQNASPDGGP